MKEEIEKFFKGEIFDDEETLSTYSKDASLFKVKPSLVVWPVDKDDLAQLVTWVKENKTQSPELSLTIRAAGSCMSGGSLNESIIADVTKHLNHAGETEGTTIVTEPGVFYHDFEKKTLEKDLLLPCYTASKNLCALGGMIGNNCGGEKSLRYGKMENFIVESKWIFADGKEYTVKPGFIDNPYSQKIFDLIKANEAMIKSAKPMVAKNSAGFYLWNVMPGGPETFDLNKLLVGSQGTLGIMTEATVRLVKTKPHHDLVALFFNSWQELPKVVKTILAYEPEGLETFDEETIKLGIKFMPEIAKKAHMSLLSFLWQFLPEAWISIKMHGLPKLVVLAEIAEESETLVKAKVEKIVQAVSKLKVQYRVVEKDSEEEKFWVMRRESFNLLRQHVAGKRTAPFVDDISLPIEYMNEALPKVKKILEKNGLKANIAGHAGEGNFHIIPLIDPKDRRNIEIIKQVSEEIYDLVNKYKGSITGEHNDGLVRTPYLHKMYSKEVLGLFQEVKNIFDPQNIFNPGKKVPSNPSGQAGSLEYFEKHLDLG